MSKNSRIDNFTFIEKKAVLQDLKYVYDYDATQVDCIISSDDEFENGHVPTTVCNFCNKKLLSRNALLQHMNILHGFNIKNVEHRRKLCNKEFKFKRNLMLHNTNKHKFLYSAHEKIFNCPFCEEKIFSRVKTRLSFSFYLLI